MAWDLKRGDTPDERRRVRWVMPREYLIADEDRIRELFDDRLESAATDALNKG